MDPAPKMPWRLKPRGVGHSYTCRVIPAGQEVSQAALRSLAAAGQDLADAKDLDGALGVLAEAAASAAGATMAVIRVAERGSEELHARGVWAASPALRAELEGSRLAEGEIGSKDLTEDDGLPEAVRRLARRWGASRVLICPVSSEGRVLVSLELARAGEPFTEHDVALARVIASHASLIVRAVDPADGHSPATGREAAIELAGRA